MTFAYATWMPPSDGFVDIQSNFRAGREVKLFVRKQHGVMMSLHGELPKSPANIICHTAKGVQFQKCLFTHLGGAGSDLECGAQDNLVNDCEFCDISGTGIQVGDVQKEDHHPDDPRLIVKNNRIANSRIHDIGVEYEVLEGTSLATTEGTVIAHNEICNVPYSGIGLGWGWGEADAGGGAHEFYGVTIRPRRRRTTSSRTITSTTSSRGSWTALPSIRSGGSPARSSGAITFTTRTRSPAASISTKAPPMSR